jgi:hypothetical protein
MQQISVHVREQPAVELPYLGAEVLGLRIVRKITTLKYCSTHYNTSGPQIQEFKKGAVEFFFKKKEGPTTYLGQFVGGPRPSGPPWICPCALWPHQLLNLQ